MLILTNFGINRIYNKSQSLFMFVALSFFAGKQGTTIVFSLFSSHCLAVVSSLFFFISLYLCTDKLEQNQTRLNDRRGEESTNEVPYYNIPGNKTYNR